MALQAPGAYAGVIGNLYARQNLGEIYARRKTAGDESSREGATASDRVELSQAVPRPLSARLVEEAQSVSESLAGGRDLTAAQTSALRENRIFAAVSVLMTLGVSGDENVIPSWPGGIPSPTRDEMEAAYRRLSQRLDRLDEAGDPDQAAQDRLALLDKGRGMDFQEISSRLTVEFPSAGEAR